MIRTRVARGVLHGPELGATVHNDVGDEDTSDRYSDRRLGIERLKDKLNSM